jgi:hypothetical protein
LSFEDSLRAGAASGNGAPPVQFTVMILGVPRLAERRTSNF